MGRIARVVVPKVPHHVTQRGNRRRSCGRATTGKIRQVDGGMVRETRSGGVGMVPSAEPRSPDLEAPRENRQADRPRVVRASPRREPWLDTHVPKTGAETLWQKTSEISMVSPELQITELPELVTPET